MVSSANKELKDKIVTELSIGILKSIKERKNEYEYSSRFHSFAAQ